MIEKVKTWWGNLKESTRKSIKTLAETFVGTFLVTFATGLLGGFVSIDSLESLCIAAASAAVAAIAAKLVNIGGDIVDDAEKIGGSNE